MYGYVYKTTNLINDKIYIGQHKSSQFDERYKGSGDLLWKAINKYGWDNFQVELLVECESQDELNHEEKRLIKEYNATDKQVGYNLSLGGQNPVLVGENNPLYGKHRSKEVRDQISKTKTGVKRTPEQVAQMSITTKKLYDDPSYVEKRSNIMRNMSTGRKWIHNGSDNKFVTSEDYDYYTTQEGWIPGMAYRPRSNSYKEYCRTKGKSQFNNIGRKWINNGTENRFVKLDELDYYINNNWILGMIYKERGPRGPYNVNHEKMSKESSNRSLGRKWVNNGTENKFVKPEDLDWYLNNGYVLGMKYNHKKEGGNQL